MSDGDDTRVLNMRINNKEFLKGTSDSLKAIDTLNKGIDDAGKGKGMQSLSKSIDTVGLRFDKLQTIGTAALATITARATNAGINLVKNLTIGPISAGFKEYQLGLDSIQAIMAATGESVGVVNKRLDELNHYADKTIYNFGDMVSSVKTFTNAGIGLKDATTMVKGFANEAAVSGTNAQQAAGAAYQLSQALNNGVVKLMDWKSLTNANMGNAKMRKGLVELADAMGTFEGSGTSAEKAQKTFNATLEKGWLTSDVMSKYLKIQAGEMTNAEMKTLGLSKTQIEYFKKAAKTAEDSAIKIKSFPQMMGTIKEAIGSGWASIFRSLFGDLDQSIALWTKVGTTITDAIGGIFDSIQGVLDQWQKMGGYTKFWAAVGNIFKALGNIVRPFVDAFKSILPTTEGAGNGMIRFTESFYNFSVWLEKVTRGVEKFKPAVSGIGSVLLFPFKILSGLVDIFKNLFDNIDIDIVDKLANGFTAVGEAIAGAFDGGTVNTLLAGVSAGLLGGIFLILKMFIGRVTTLFSGGFFGGGGFLDSMKDSFQAVTNSLQSMQTLLQAKTLQAIAIAVALLAASMVALSMVKPDRLGAAMEAMTVAFVQLLAAMAILVKISGSAGFVRLPIIAGSLVLLATSILILSAAAKVMSTMDWEELAKGLTGLGGALLAISLFTATLGGSSAKIAAVGLAMIPLAAGVLLLAGALMIMSKMTWEEIGKGLATLLGSLLAIAGAMSLMPLSLPITAAGLLAIGVSINLIAASLRIMAGLSWTEIGKGLTVIAGSIIAIGLAMRTMPMTLPITAAGLVLVSIALQGIALAVKSMSGMSWEEIGKGLVALGGALLVLGVGLRLMSGAIPGAIALGLVAAALALLVPELIALGSVSWSVIAKGLAALAGTLAIISVAGLVAGPVLMALGAAVLLVGGGIFLAGAGVALLATGLATLGGVAKNTGVALGEAFIGFFNALPTIAVKIVETIAVLLDTLAQNAPRIVESIVTIVGELLNGLRALIPDLIQTGIDLILGIVNGITDRMDDVVQAGLDFILAFLDGIGESTEELALAAGELILDFLEAINEAVDTYTEPIVQTGMSIGRNLIEGLILGLIPEPIQQAFMTFVDKVVGFFKGLLGINSPSTVFAGFGRNIVEGLISGITSLAGSVGGAIGTLVSNIVSAISSLPGKFKGALSGFAGTVRGVFTGAFNAGRTAVTAGVSAIGSAVGKIAGTVGGAVSSAGEKARGLGSAIVKGIGKGLGAAVNAVGNLGSALIRGIKDAINSALKLPFNIPKFSIKLGPKSFSVGGQRLIPRFAKGVTGFGGGSALVGEVGPELVTMGRGANVITNENLVKFMQQVAKLTKVMSSRNESQKISGGNIQYVVSADFRGDPKSSGIAFAGNLAAGLIQGLKRTQTPVNDAVSGMGSKMAGAFASTLGIRSPSKVFEQYAKYVGEGFILGLLSTTNAVSAAGLIMAKSATDIVSKTITDAQLQYEAMKAEADAYAAAAKNTKLSKSERKKMSDAAKKAAAAAEKQKEIADKANAEADRKVQFEAADASGKASMRNEDALTQAQLASDLRTEAIKLTKEADLIAKRDKKKSAELDALAQKQLEAAQAAANLAETYAKEASDFAAQGRSGMTNGQQILSVTAEDVAKAQAAFEAYVKSYTDAQTAAKEENSQPKEITFQQNNYSPEAISPADAYRNGKSLVSLAEKKLAPTG